MAFCQSPMKVHGDIYSPTVAVTMLPQTSSHSTQADKHCFISFLGFHGQSSMMYGDVLKKSLTLDIRMSRRAASSAGAVAPVCQNGGSCLPGLTIRTCIFASGTLKTSLHSPNASLERRKKHFLRKLNLFLWCLAFWHFLPLLNRDNAARETIGTLSPVTAVTHTAPSPPGLPN